MSGQSPDQSPKGLAAEEAALRLKRDGYNELPSAPRRTVSHIALEVAREPMFLLLIAAGLVYLLLGSASDALMLLAFVLLAMSITIYQERKTERVLEALRDLSSPRALVVRDGERRRIAGREVVQGDLIVLTEGDRVPADARLLSAHDLQLDESLLSGESLPVPKAAAPQQGEARPVRPGDDAAGCIFAGTMVTGSWPSPFTAGR